MPLPSQPKHPSKNQTRRRQTIGHSPFGLQPKALRTLRALNTPVKIQRFLDALPYQYADTAWSPARALRERKGHCLEGALLAAAALRINGHPPLLMDLEAIHDDDHVIALYRERGLWGGIAKSNFAGLRFRAPIYRTLRELALSYFESYYNLRGERTLRSYSRQVNLARLDSQHWMTSEQDVWCVRTSSSLRATIRSFPPKSPAPCPASTAAAFKPVCMAGRSTEAIRPRKSPHSCWPKILTFMTARS